MPPAYRRGRDFLLLMAAACALVFFFSHPGTSIAGGLTIVVPPDRSVVEGELVTLVLKAWSTEVDEIQIFVNNRKQPVAAKHFDQSVVCYDGVRLSNGLNSIKVIALKKGKKNQEATVKVFQRSDLSSASSDAPAGYTRFFFHVDKNEKECLSCHDLDFRKEGAKQGGGPDQSPCSLCHKKILSGHTFVHGPSAVWSCLMCHDGKSQDSKLAVNKPVDKLCANCHENDWEQKKYRHAPAAAGLCTTCHNPHAADAPYFLRSGVVALCASCHEEVFSRPHVVVSFSGNSGHPLQKSPNPLNPGTDLTCVSCHNPHAGNSNFFLNGYDEAKPRQQFCQSCHKK